MPSRMTRLQALRTLDASPIVPGIWQGSAPPAGTALRDAGFDAVVLAAVEYQPSDESFPGVHVIRAPIEDTTITPAIWSSAKRAADEVAQLRRHNARVLVTCRAGLNRSGLITAMVLIMDEGMLPAQAIARVRSGRFMALSNESFATALRRSRG